MKTAEKEAKRESLKQRKDSDILNDIFSNQDQELGQDLADMLDEKEIPVFDEEAGEEIVDFEDDISKRRENWEAECPGREELDAEEVKEIQNESNKLNEAQDESSESNEANEAHESSESSKEDRKRDQAKGQKADWEQAKEQSADWEKAKEQEADWEQTKDTQIDWGQSNGQDSVWEQPGENPFNEEQPGEDQSDENQPNAENPGYKPWPVSEEMREKERTSEDSSRETIIVQIPDGVMQEQPQDEREIQPEKAIFNPPEDDNAPVVYIDFSQETEEHEKKRSKDLLNPQEQGEGKNGAEWNLEEDVEIEQDDEEPKKRPWWYYLLIALGAAAIVLLLLLFL